MEVSIDMKKTMILSLIFLLALAVTGCQNSTTTQTAISGEGGYLGKYDEEILVNTIKYIDPTASSNLAKLTSLTGETLEDNRWIRGFVEDMNVRFNYMITGSGESFQTQWAGLMATGDLPDIFPVGFSDMAELAETGFLQDLTAAYEAYASPLLKEILAEAGDSALDSARIDGKLYGIPQVVSKYDSYKYLWIRRDWMAEVGVTSGPKTVYELVDLMGKFVNQDPDNNGRNDTYAFSLSNDLWHNLEGFFACFGAYPDSWVFDSTAQKIKLGAIQDAMIEPLTILQNMFNNGWLNPEFITLDYTKSKADVANGKVGIYMGAHYNATDFLLASKNKNPNADWAVFEWPGKTETDVVKHELELGVNNVVVASAAFGNPEIAVKMMNYYYEKLYGETGNYDFWGNDQVDLIWAMGPLFSYRPTVNLIPYLDIQAYYLGQKTEADMIGVSRNYFKNVVTDNRYDWQIMFGRISPHASVTGGETAGYFLNRIVNGTTPSFQDQFYGPPTPSMGIVGAQLGFDSLEFFTKVIRNERNLTNDFVAFREYWLSNGGSVMTEEINAKYGW
jgi:putative aldouronate transport system substrate-binding protein